MSGTRESENHSKTMAGAKAKLNPRTVHREFFGVPGALGITLGLPLLIMGIAYCCDREVLFKGFRIDVARLIEKAPADASELAWVFFDTQCWVAYLTWFGVFAIFDQLLPGTHLKGIPLRDGTQLQYKINGRLFLGVFLSLLASRALISDDYHLPELDFVYDHQVQLTGVTIVFSFLLSLAVYLASFVPLTKPNGVGSRERILSINGNSGNAFYDWFIGRELNPRISSWDIKLFCELRPGLLLWLLINLSCVHHQYHSSNTISDSLLLVTGLQAFYVFDGVLNEEGVISMMDITTDGFGFMLVFGDLAWLPWVYSLQARYLALSNNPTNIGTLNCLLIMAVNFSGYYIFHSANKQKSDFRMGKLDHENLRCIETKTGSKLLCDGWWGLSQHINYFGDWLIGISWCLPTGFNTIYTYFYVIYFGVLLLHRQLRDEAKCKQKYGKEWEQYQKMVPYKIIPYLY